MTISTIQLYIISHHLPFISCILYIPGHNMFYFSSFNKTKHLCSLQCIPHQGFVCLNMYNITMSRWRVLLIATPKPS